MPKVNIYGGNINIPVTFTFKKRLIAVVVMAIGAFVAIQLWGTNDLNAELFEKYYKPPNHLITLLAEDESPNGSVKAFLQAEKAIEMGKYHRAIELYDRIIAKNDPLCQDARWYKGLCLLKINADDEKIHNHFLLVMNKKGKYRQWSFEILQQKFYNGDSMFLPDDNNPG